MKYRLKVKRGKKWRIGQVIYESYLDAQIRQEELKLIGISSKIVDKIGGELSEIMA